MIPPLTPDADQARALLADELAKPTYLDPQNWLRDQLQKLLDWISGGSVPSAGLSGPQLAAVVVGVVAVVAVIVWTLMGPLRAERRGRTQVVADPDVNADQLRDRARRLAGEQAWGPATLELFRALVRSLAERTIIDEFSGMTAQEAAGRAASRLPSFTERLDRAATTFDELAYGHQQGSREQYERLAGLDTELSATRPSLAADAGTPGPEPAQ